MAKLNGVTVVSEKITYNDAEYVKTDAAAKVGDIVRCDDGDYVDIDEGDFFVVETGADGWFFRDNGGDKRDFGDNYGYAVDADDFTVFTKVDAKPATVPVQYREVKRKAAVGERIKIVDATAALGYGNGDEGVVLEAYGAGIRAGINGNSRGVYHSEYVVLVPVAVDKPTLPDALPSDYVIHDGAVYRKESRQAKVGEKIEVNQSHLGYVKGDVATVTVIDNDDTVKADKFPDTWMMSKRYRVLVPTDTVTLSGPDGTSVEYTLEKRSAAKGEAVLCVKGAGSGKDATGDIGVTTDGNESVPDVTWNNGKKGIINRNRFLVLTPKATAKPAQPDRLKVGDYAKVVGDKHPSYFGGKDGEIVKIVEVRSSGYKCEALDGSTWGGNPYADEADVIRATDEEVAAANRKNVKIGDYVRITQDQCGEKSGTIVEVTEVRGNGSIRYKSDKSSVGTFCASSTAYEPVTPAEAEAARKPKLTVGSTVKLTLKDGQYPRHGWGSVKNGDIGKVTEVYGGDKVKVDFPAQKNWTARDYELTVISEVEAEEAAAKAAEEAKWRKIGRKVGEIRKGDVVRVTAACSGRNPNGRIGIAKSDGTTGSTCVTTVENPEGHSCMACVELVAPVESLFNVKEA